ncbi:WD40 repeat-like protein [Clavulina sp. PMI_390]|nr:WD40 repeat-like protein [Clavulina sp. PMI_390]
MSSDRPWTLKSVAKLEGHQDRAWNVAWNPTQPLLASCSSDKSVRLYHYSTLNGSLEEARFQLATVIPTGHTRTVRGIAWSPSGTSLATASFDSTVAIWERAQNDDEAEGPASGEWECASTLEGHESECKSVAYSYNGGLLASCSRDKSVWVWEVQPDADFECMSVLMEHSQDVKCVAWHPKEEILASASYDDTIKLYLDDPEDDWFPFDTLTGHTSTVWSVAFSPSGKYLASCSDDLSIKIWMRERVPRAHGPPGATKEQWSCQLTIPNAHERTIYCISWTNAQGNPSDSEVGWLASVGGDGATKIWRIWDQSAPEEPPMVHHDLITSIPDTHGDADVNAVAWCPQEGFQDLLATAGDDGVIQVWKISPT